MHLYLLLFIVGLAVGAVPEYPAGVKKNTYNFPQATLPSTPGILPQYGIQLGDGAQNVVDLTFGKTIAGATIKNVNQLANVAYFYDLFGAPSSPRTFPIAGIPGNFLGMYSVYPEYLADNVTRNPLAVHQVLDDRLRLVARSTINGSDAGTKYELGYIRLPTQFLPGMAIELRLAPGGWPTCQWSWPTFWAYSGVQIPDKIGNVTRWYSHTYGPSLEWDFFDGYTTDGGVQGESIPMGTPFVGDQSLTHFPDDIYRAGDDTYEYGQDGLTNANRLHYPASLNPTNPKNGLVVLADWTDRSTVKFFYNGVLVRTRHVYDAAGIGSVKGGDWDGTAPPASRLGQQMPMFVIVSHQFAPLFNPRDLAALQATTTPVVANYDIMSVRVWDRASIVNPKNSTPTVALPAPITGAALGDLPAITSGTYVLNLEVVNGVALDHFGSNVTLLGNALIIPANGTNALNSRETLFLQNTAGAVLNSAVSITGRAVSFAQNGGNFMLFQVVENLLFGSVYTYAAFTRRWPTTDAPYKKVTLMSNQPQQITAILQSDSTADCSISNSSITVHYNRAHIAVLNQSLASDNTVTVGVGINNYYWAPASGRGVPVSQLDGYTELLIGQSRDRYNFRTMGAHILVGQVLMVAFAKGKTLSNADLLSIRNYLVQKWNIVNQISNETIINTTGVIQPQIGTRAPPAKSSFTAVGATSSVSGGSTTPLQVVVPPQQVNNSAFLLLPIASANVTFTAYINFSLPWANTLNGGVYNSMSAGLAIRNSATQNATTFGLFYPSETKGLLRPYWYLPGSSNGTIDDQVMYWYARAGNPFWMRIVVAGATTTFLSSVTGRVNSWEPQFSFPTAWCNANQIGFFLNTLAPVNFTTSASISVLHMDPLLTTAQYQVQSSLFTNNYPTTTTTTGASATTAAAATSTHATTAASATTSTHATTAASATTSSHATTAAASTTGHATTSAASSSHGTSATAGGTTATSAASGTSSGVSHSGYPTPSSTTVGQISSSSYVGASIYLFLLIVAVVA